MKHYSDYETQKKQARQTGSTQLPLGTYVCQVKQVRVIDEDSDKERIEILYDIAEGEHKDFYKKAYDNSSTDEDKKWKGRILIWSPLDDGSETDQWTKNTHAKWMNAFEDSNKGYSWAWDASSLKGKKFGITLRQCGKIIDGKHIKFNEIAYPCAIEDAKSHSDRVGKFKAYKGFDENAWKASQNKDVASNDTTPDFMKIADISEEEIPF